MATSTTTMSGAATSTDISTADEKIRKDLATLKEKMDMCDSMLGPTSLSVQSSEAMLAVVGFLEACAPRMLELVEAGASGAISEDVFAECLSANDRLQKQLADVESAAPSETATTSTATDSAAAAASDPSSVQQQFEDLVLDDGGNEAAGSTAPAAAKSTGVEDDFDAFLAERTQQSS